MFHLVHYEARKAGKRAVGMLSFNHKFVSDTLIFWLLMSLPIKTCHYFLSCINADDLSFKVPKVVTLSGMKCLFTLVTNNYQNYLHVVFSLLCVKFPSCNGVLGHVCEYFKSLIPFHHILLLYSYVKHFEHPVILQRLQKIPLPCGFVRIQTSKASLYYILLTSGNCLDTLEFDLTSMRTRWPTLTYQKHRMPTS